MAMDPTVDTFQFPSNGKGHAKTTNASEDALVATSEFQFPSNGKGHAKVIAVSGCGKTEDGFNSLQTGKGMQS